MKDLSNLTINFIASTSRTGSTLLSSMLNMHNEVLSFSEEPFLYSLYPKYKNTTNWTDEIIEEFCSDFYLFSEANLKFQFGKKADLEKTLKEHRKYLSIETVMKLTCLVFLPHKDKAQITTIVDKELKFHHVLNEVADFYPESKFIVLIRDPRDTVLINLKKKKRENAPGNLILLAKAWDYLYKTLDEKTVLLPRHRYIKIKYEDLVENPEAVLKQITAFLNITYDSNMLKYDEAIRKNIEEGNDLMKRHINFNHQGLIQKVNTNKIGIWKTELTTMESDIIWSICEKTAEQHDYLRNNCRKINYLNLNTLKDLLQFYSSNIIIPKLYFSAPFFLKYLVKKIKYKKTLPAKMTN